MIYFHFLWLLLLPLTVPWCWRLVVQGLCSHFSTMSHKSWLRSGVKKKKTKANQPAAGKRGFMCDFVSWFHLPFVTGSWRNAGSLVLYLALNKDCSLQGSFMELIKISLKFQEQVTKHGLCEIFRLLEECGFNSKSLLADCSGNTWGKGIKESRGSIWHPRGNSEEPDITELLSGRISGLTLLWHTPVLPKPGMVCIKYLLSRHLVINCLFFSCGALFYMKYLGFLSSKTKKTIILEEFFYPETTFYHEEEKGENTNLPEWGKAAKFVEKNSFLWQVEPEGRQLFWISHGKQVVFCICTHAGFVSSM